jgi:hypothetical protein
MGVGAVIGGLFTAARGHTGLRPMIIASAGSGAAILASSRPSDHDLTHRLLSQLYTIDSTTVE